MPRKNRPALIFAVRRQGRPAASDAGIGRRKLIEATRELLRTVPVDQLTAGRIAQAAGGDRALVRYYFGDLSALIAETLEEALEQFSAELLSRIEAASAGPGPAASRLKRRVRAFIRFQLENPATHRLFIDQIINAQTRWGRRLRNKNWRRGLASLRALLDEGEGTGEFRGGVDERLLEIAIVGLSEFAIRSRPILKLFLSPEEDLAGVSEAYAEFAADLVLGGISSGAGKARAVRADAKRRGRPGKRGTT